jgi:hypothetical protein
MSCAKTLCFPSLIKVPRAISFVIDSPHKISISPHQSRSCEGRIPDAILIAERVRCLRAVSQPAPGRLRASCSPALRPVRGVLPLDWDRKARVTPVRTASQEAWPEAEPRAAMPLASPRRSAGRRARPVWRAHAPSAERVVTCAFAWRGQWTVASISAPPPLYCAVNVARKRNEIRERHCRMHHCPEL